MMAVRVLRGPAMTLEVDWYATNGCDHGHCPLDCPKPQPALVNGVMLCMRCWVLSGVVSVMVPCVPATCGEAGRAAVVM